MYKCGNALGKTLMLLGFLLSFVLIILTIILLIKGEFSLSRGPAFWSLLIFLLSNSYLKELKD